jgi:hypothetical protein
MASVESGSCLVAGFREQNRKPSSIKLVEFLGKLSDCQLLKKSLLQRDCKQFFLLNLMTYCDWTYLNYNFTVSF